MMVSLVSAEDYKFTYLAITNGESDIQSEACAQATTKNKELATMEFKGQVDYELISSNKKLLLTDSDDFHCEVEIVWGVVVPKGSNSLVNDFNVNLSQDEIKILGDGGVFKKGMLSLELGHTFSFQLPKGYEGMEGQSLMLSYLTKHKIEFRLMVLSSNIKFRFDENGKTVSSKSFEGVGLGIGKEIIRKDRLSLGVTADLIESFPFSQDFESTYEDKIIVKKISSDDYVRLGLPVRYDWNKYFVKGVLSRSLIDQSPVKHPYNISLSLGYEW
jgi:hypothetical protein